MPDSMSWAVRGLLAGGLPAAFTAQPLAVDEVRAGEMGGHPAAAATLDRLAVVLLRGRPGRRQRTRTGRQPERPRAAAGLRACAELFQRGDRVLRLVGAGGRLDQLGQRQARVRQLVGPARPRRRPGSCSAVAHPTGVEGRPPPRSA
jgi:hypothetical protein